MKNFASELSISIILLILLGIIFFTWSMAMPDYVMMSLVIGIAVLFIFFAAFIWKEGRGDEREAFHRLFADRAAYLAGSAFLLIGIVVGEATHASDPWLILALAVMVATKVIGLIYSKIKL